MPRKPPADIRVFWSRREGALVYHAVPTCGGWLSHVWEGVALPHEGKTFVAELEARGFDLTTLHLQIRKKALP